MKQHENYRELIWILAKTDFKLRYHGSVLGYLWALLKPLLTFAVLNFVFSSMFNPRGTGISDYSLQLLVALMMFYFFSEGTSAGMGSLLSKAQLVTKIYVPRWTIILASTINATLIFLMNLLVIAFFFAVKGFMPSLAAIGMFLLFSVFIYIIVLSFALVTAPLYVKFRDLAMIWEVLIMIILYASPIIYPLTTLPAQYHKFILLNPLAFIIHFTKESMLNDHFASLSQYGIFIAIVFGFFAFSIWAYRKLIVKVAEDI
ncbi:MAG: ABC-2 type transporter [Candidatus Moranbacteria bacterium GW2011_GWE1_35_17]|nr:MAG: ABC-2 type transporter [Candidatus Moranbacteria bacterium GW2011_GWE1_35_17]KKP81552.1 MAG: ABC-2 type transporter [Candidatus Moranbacteria bacterium GW2011_GWF2_35_54]KKP82131.1 MAG: ABC-2 type transporter [Candidatus Moranbacteria bacterium GW2011_GWF1_35_5]